MSAKTQLTYTDSSILTFSYDPAGNRQTGPDSKDTYAYNAGNQLTNDKNHQYHYDKNGNLTKKTETDDDGDTETYTYSYDYENRLIKVVKQESLTSTSTLTLSFKYDPFSRRIEKKLEETEDDETETKTYTYLYDNEDIILEYLTKTDDNETKTETTRYIHGTGIDEPLAIERKNEIYYYYTDGLGSITALTDKKQKIVESYEYDSFGNLKRKGDKVKNAFTYTGREYDKETGLYYYRARYYDAEVGRFLTKDPIGFEGGDTNMYGYAGNNPVNFTDPLGLQNILPPIPILLLLYSPLYPSLLPPILPPSQIPGTCLSQPPTEEIGEFETCYLFDKSPTVCLYMCLDGRIEPILNPNPPFEESCPKTAVFKKRK